MSFFAQGDDDEALTLEAALAFIDSCENASDGTTPVAFDVSAEQLVPHESADESAVSSHSSSSSTPRTAPSTRQNRRQKREVLSLRDQVGELEALLAQLHQQHGLNSDGRVSPTRGHLGNTRGLGSTEAFRAMQPPSIRGNATRWMDIAACERRRRQRSEATNLQLKAISRGMNALLRTVAKQTNDHTAFKTRLYRSPSSRESQAPVMAELQHSVLGMYLESDAIFSCAAASPLCVSSDAETRYEPGVGTYVDLRSTTPIAFDFREVAELMWQETNAIRSFRDKTCVVIPRADGNSTERTYCWTIRHDEQSLQLTGLQYIQKYQTPSRVVIARSGVAYLPNKGLKFREKTWMDMAASPMNPSSDCVMRTCFRLSVELDDGCVFNPVELNPLRTFITNAMVGGMRAFGQTTRKLLLEASCPIRPRNNATSSFTSS